MAGEIEQYVGHATHEGANYEVYLQGNRLQIALPGKPGTLYYGDLKVRYYNLPQWLYFPVRTLLETKHIVRPERTDGRPV